MIGNVKKDICFSDFVSSIKDILPSDSAAIKPSNLDQNVILNEVMATCHSITMVEDEYVGDPLEIKMFLLTDWILDDKKTET